MLIVDPIPLRVMQLMLGMHCQLIFLHAIKCLHYIFKQGLSVIDFTSFLC